MRMMLHLLLLKQLPPAVSLDEASIDCVGVHARAVTRSKTRSKFKSQAAPVRPAAGPESASVAEAETEGLLYRLVMSWLPNLLGCRYRPRRKTRRVQQSRHRHRRQ
ncbi:hypothetical protein C8R46DRAFT_1109554 [Mycena filopes]|nr:hypothetical protein C8R46DRAFT_1109554 [Mycena filopes]